MLSRRRALRGSAALLTSVLATSGVGLLAAAGPAGAAAPPRLSVRTVLTGLDAPRGIAFDGSGAMYVAQSGKALPGPAGTTRSGSVSRYARGSATAAWRTSFTSLHDALHGAPEALGPEGLSVLPGSCPATSSACDVRMIMSESQVGQAATGSPLQLGNLYVLDAQTGRARAVSNVGDQQWAWTLAHKDLFPDFPDANPYGVLVTRHAGHVRTFVVDAGANTVSEVLPGGATHVVAYIPNETTVARRDSTPTCVAQGPDGALYVGTLDLASNLAAQGGQSSVWRVDPDSSRDVFSAATRWASGLTTLSACTFDRSGAFWGAEIFGPTTQGAPGDVVRIPFRHPAAVQHLGNGQVVLPGGIAQGPDGAVYVTTHTADPAPGSGQVLRLAVDD